jgi:hypothetical protein
LIVLVLCQPAYLLQGSTAKAIGLVSLLDRSFSKAKVKPKGFLSEKFATLFVVWSSALLVATGTCPGRARVLN